MKRHSRAILITIAVLLCSASVGFAQLPSDEPENVVAAERPVDGIGISLFYCYTRLQDTIAANTTGMYGSLVGSFRGLATTIVAIYVTIVGYKMVKGDVEAPKKAATTLILTVIVTSIVFSPGAWSSWIAGPILGTIQGTSTFLTSKATGGAGGNIFASLSQGMDLIMSVSTKINASTSSWQFVEKFEGLIAQLLLAAVYIAVVVTFMLINIMSWFAIYIMMVFGGICFYFAIYDSTRHIFWAWLRAVCNYGLVVVFASLIMGICNGMLNDFVSQLAAQDYGTVDPIFNKAYISTLCACILTWCMLLRAPDFAAALSGGSAGNTAGIAGVVSMSAGAAYGGIKYLAAKRAAAAGGFLGQHLGDSPGGGALGSMARGAGHLARGAGLGPSARKGIDNSNY